MPLATVPGVAVGLSAVPELDAVLALDRNRVGGPSLVLYENLQSLVPGAAPLARHIEPTDLGLAGFDQVISVDVVHQQLYAFTFDGLFMGTLDGSEPGQKVQSPILEPSGFVADDSRIVVSSPSAFAVGTRVAGTWQWSAPVSFLDQGQRGLLALLPNELLVSHQEQRDTTVLSERRWISAEVVRIRLDGEVIARYPTRGNPSSILAKDGGYLISEVNSYWGSMRAALEWLDPQANELRTLTNVIVRSSTDGIDGAHATALLDAGGASAMLYVANGESLLRRSAWSTTALTLTSVEGPWNGASAVGEKVESIASSGDVLVVSGADEKLHFLKACIEE